MVETKSRGNAVALNRGRNQPLPCQVLILRSRILHLQCGDGALNTSVIDDSSLNLRDYTKQAYDTTPLSEGKFKVPRQATCQLYLCLPVLLTLQLCPAILIRNPGLSPGSLCSSSHLEKHFLSRLSVLFPSVWLQMSQDP